MRISAEQFIKVYMQEGGAVSSIATVLGVSNTAVHTRVRNYRKLGVKFPTKRVAANKIDVKRLNNLIKELKNAKQSN